MQGCLPGCSQPVGVRADLAARLPASVPEGSQPDCSQWAACGAESGLQRTPAASVSSENFWLVQLEAIYRRRNPLKLAKVPEFLERYRGEEAVLYRKVCRAYDLCPTKFYADPAAWVDEDQDIKPERTSSEAASGGLLASLAAAVRHLKRPREEAAVGTPCAAALGAAAQASAGDFRRPFAFDLKRGIAVFGCLKPQRENRDAGSPFAALARAAATPQLRHRATRDGWWPVPREETGGKACSS